MPGGRLTNLTQLTVDTASGRITCSATDPNLDPDPVFAHAVPSLSVATEKTFQEATTTLSEQHQFERFRHNRRRQVRQRSIQLSLTLS